MNATLTLDPARIDKGLARLTSFSTMMAFQGLKMPLGMFAGLHVTAIDRTSCTVAMPGGWRTRNPFGTTYWAAQGMAAEMATGLHGFVLCDAAPRKVAMILAGCEGQFTRKCIGRSIYRFEQGDRVREVIEETLRTGERVTCPTEVVGYDPAGEEISRWTFTWSFKAKA